MTYGPRSGVSPPTVTVTSPNGGEDWMKTKTYPITWEARGNLNDTSVDLAYSLDNGTTWTDIATGKPNTGFYKWTVPSTETSGALIRVTVLDIDYMLAKDTSDATFAIDPPAPKAGDFHSPSEGETLGPGPTTLSWTVEDPWGLAEAPLTLELSTDGGSSWSKVAEGLPFTDGIQWDVPGLSTSSDACRLRLSVRSWLGDVSVIESGEFSIDVSPPSVSWNAVPKSMVEGETYRIEVEAYDDLADLQVVLHVSGPEGERTYTMVMEGEGVWSAELEARLDDEAIWVSASDGIGSVDTSVRGLEVASSSASSEGANGSLAAELVLATAMAVIVVVVVAVLVGRRR
jgi:hypothetical protein